MGLVASLTVPLSGCLAARSSITDVTAIPVSEGATRIARFVPDGRSGLVIDGSLAALREPDAVMVLLPRLAPSRGWDVVGFADASTGRITTTLADTVGEARAVRFARAKVGGTPETLMFVAHGGGGPGRPAAVAIDIYRLATDGDDGSGLPAVFDPIRHFDTRGSYCSPDAALVDVENLPPASPGPLTRDGCAAAGS